MLNAHRYDAPPPLSSVASQRIPPALESIVMRCLEKDPAQRFASAKQMAESLARAVGDL